jgi:DNA-binding NtrC family response regulator
MKILVVDDNLDSLQSLRVVLQDLDHQPVACDDPRHALRLAEKEYFPLVITDIRMPGIDGLDLLSRLKLSPEGRYSDVIIITGHGDMETAIEALRKGAYDYLNKPINARELAAAVERSAEHQALLRENHTLTERFTETVEQATTDLRRDLKRANTMLRENAGIGNIVAESASMRRLTDQARIYHDNPDVSVLIEGETGSGKEVFARLIHHGNSFCEAPFVAVNCSAIPENLFESELFGYEAGAFTGGSAKGSRGKLELAGQGTLFLDEISELPLSLQPKLLRALEDRTFYRVGGLKLINFNARVICAGNRDLADLVKNGRFRSDLFHRLKVGHIRIPPLRERTEEIGSLVEFCIERECKNKKRSIRSISTEALQRLKSHAWTGNVRELENTIQRAVLMCEGDVLEARHFDFLESEDSDSSPASLVNISNTDLFSLPEGGLDLAGLNDSIIRKALEKFEGNKTKAAAYLGISRYALHRKVRNGS